MYRVSPFNCRSWCQVWGILTDIQSKNLWEIWSASYWFFWRSCFLRCDTVQSRINFAEFSEELYASMFKYLFAYYFHLFKFSSGRRFPTECFSVHVLLGWAIKPLTFPAPPSDTGYVTLVYFWNSLCPDYIRIISNSCATKLRWGLRWNQPWIVKKANIQKEKKFILGKLCFEDYRLIVERGFARPSDTESYAGGSLSSW
jgi:hypothetical protein